MADEFFSDRESGPLPRTIDDLPDAAWAGLAALFGRMVNQDLFAEAFPVRCEDQGKGVYSTAGVHLLDSLRGLVPGFDGWPRAADNPGHDRLHGPG